MIEGQRGMTIHMEAGGLSTSRVDTNAPCTPAAVSAESLKRAYAQCREITAQHSKSFSLAARILPADKRPAIWALYAFCRTVDDTVDDASADTVAVLEMWRRITLHGYPMPENPVAVAWADALARFHVPKQYALELIDGVERDLVQTRYQTFADLETYCYAVASTVGLMSMHIIGFSSPEALPYAVKLGIALQMTNILRDVGEDWRQGRLYLPLEELAEYDLTETDIARGMVTDAWRQFMDFQIVRTRALYREAWPGIGMLHPDGQFAIAAAASFYRAILDQIERLDYNVFSNRAHVSQKDKLGQLPAIWWRTRFSPGYTP